MKMPQHELWYKAPARCWNEALPLGNGRLGAMIFGRTGEELAELNEDTLWAGYPRQFPPGNFFEELETARKLLAEGKRLQADQWISERMLVHHSQGYLPAGRLKLKFHAPGGTGYRRTLDLREATHSVTTENERCEWFVSCPHQVIAMHRQGSGFTLSFDSPLKHEIRMDGEDLYLDGSCPVHVRYGELRQEDDSGHRGIRYQIRVRLIAPAASLRRTADSLTFTGGDAVVLIAIRTSFIDWKSMPEAPDYAARCKADLDRAEKCSFAELRAAHIADHQALYLRSELELPETEEDRLPTDERLRRCSGTCTPALAALLYHFGRYLLIASSRPGTQPANLQGIWNPHLHAPWGGNYTTNINLEMNYWLAEGANLSECAEPLFRFIRECAESGRAIARDYYRSDGWCLHHNSDLWRYSAPAKGKARWGFWPMGGVWLCRHIFEHYEYSGDIAFLREHYGILRGAAEFLAGFLIRNRDGEYVTSPSTSPENGYIDPASGEVTCVCGNGSAMDLELVQELLENFLEAVRILKLDEPLTERANEILSQLRSLKIGAEGQLLEYDGDYEESESTHRHLSHLYGVFPGALFTPERRPELFKAAELSLLRRGGCSTGWAMGWRLALWARFGNARRAAGMLGEFLTPVDPREELNYERGGIYPNLLAAHPPFQIDANLGVAAGISEMLVQHHRRTPEGIMILELLPALPPGWNRGSLAGVRCRNGLTLSFSWKRNLITSLEIRAGRPVTVRLVIPGQVPAVREIPAGISRFRWDHRMPCTD